MAKKKKERQFNPVIKAKLMGVIFIVTSILLFFGLGIVGKFLNAIVLFFVGYGAYPLYLAMFIVGVIYLIGKEMYKFSLIQKLSIIFICLAVMIIMALIKDVTDNTFIEYNFELFKLLKNYVTTGELENVVGGMLGYTITALLVAALTQTGAIIVSVGLILAAVVMVVEKPLHEYFKRPKREKTKVVKAKKEKKVKVKRRIFEGDIERKGPIYNYEDDETAFEEDRSIFEEDETVFEEEVEEEFSMPDLPINEPQSASVIKDEDLPFDTEVATSEVVPSPKLVKDPSKYKLPPLDLLFDNTDKRSAEDKLEIQNKAKLLVSTLKEFGVSANVVAVNVGPTVTQFEIEIKAGTKLSKVTGLSGELALALAAQDVRIQAPIPQKGTVGIEIPNTNSSLVTLKEILKAIPKNENNMTIFGLGKDIMGKPVYASLNKMPHMLVAGATGSGKSVCINSIIISIAMRAKPDQVKMLLVDPKKVELSGFNGLPHLLAPVVTNPRKAAVALQKIVAEMERRYELFSEIGSKNIESYNDKMDRSGLKDSKLPYVVVIVDELADLMLVASKEVEDSIMRITQMARAAGIHLIVATQRPSTDIITGVIKANIPSRIAFGVSSSIDSRTILDSTGAEKLLGKGDMLFVPMGANYATRIQGAFLSEEEVENVVHYCTQQQIAQFDENLVNLEETSGGSGEGGSEDELYGEVLEFVLENGSASTSLLQRRFRIGYNRASRLIDDLEMNGVIGPQNGSKPRELIE